MDITWEEWEAKYLPTHLKEDNGYWSAYFDDVADIPADIPQGRIWTMIDGDGRYANLISGVWHINALGYFVTDVAWESEDIFVSNQKEF